MVLIFHFKCSRLWSRTTWKYAQQYTLTMFSNLDLRHTFIEQFSNRFFRSNQSQLSWPPAATRIAYTEPNTCYQWKARETLTQHVQFSCRARTGNIYAGKHMCSVRAKFQRGKTYKRRKALESQNYNFFGFSTWFLSRKEVKPCDWFILHVARLSRMFFEQQYCNLKDRWQTVLSNTGKLFRSRKK